MVVVVSNVSDADYEKTSPNPHATSEIMEPDSSIKINVGGRIFETFASTISKFPESTLAAAYRHGMPELWDRDPSMFEMVLELYREGRLTRAPPDHVGVDRLVDEFAYWGFDLDIPRPVPKDWPFPTRPTPPSAKAEVPLSTFLRSLRCMDHIVHTCVLWRAIRSCSDVWTAASRGFRRMDLFWANRSIRGTSASFVRDNIEDMAWLASREGVTFEYVDECRSDEKRYDAHDTIVSGIISVEYDPEPLASMDLVVGVSTSATMIHFSSELHSTFEDGETFYEIHIQGNLLSVHTVGDAVPIEYMSDTRGAVLKPSLVIDDIEFPLDDFVFPTPTGHTCRLSMSVFSGVHRSGEMDVDAVYSLNHQSQPIEAKLIVRKDSTVRLSTVQPMLPLVMLTPTATNHSIFRLTW